MTKAHKRYHVSVRLCFCITQQDLSRMIDFDTITIDLFELAPLTEYEVYIKSFGRMETRQAATQYNDSAFGASRYVRLCNAHRVERESQTDDVESRTRWTQEPPSDLLGYGVIKSGSVFDGGCVVMPS
jgi:hypothetical protein